MKKSKCKSSDYYETPYDLFRKLDDEFNFEWDAAATAKNSLVKNRFFCEQDDALSIDWSRHAKVFFLNPPYSKEGKKDSFIKKAFEESRKGCTVVILLPVKTETSSFHNYIYNNPCAEIRFLRGRLKFAIDGVPSKGTGRFASMVVVFRPSPVEDDWG